MKFFPSSTNRKVFGQLANEYDLVYFGRVDYKLDEDYRPIGGITLTRGATDENFVSGDVYEYPVALLERLVSFKIGSRKESHHWTILQIQLQRAVDYPHMVLLGRARSTNYAAILTTGAGLNRIDWQSFGPTNPDFANKFNLFSRAENVTWLNYLIAPNVQAMLATHFSAFDYEIRGNQLFVYSVAGREEINLQMLDMILRVGLWWARSLDGIIAK